MTTKAIKPFWKMTTQELAAATAEFDQEFVADKARPLSPEQRARWERAKAKAPAATNGEQVITVRLDKKLLKKCTAFAKKKQMTRDALIARGLKAILATEGKS